MRYRDVVRRFVGTSTAAALLLATAGAGQGSGLSSDAHPCDEGLEFAYFHSEGGAGGHQEVYLDWVVMGPAACDDSVVQVWGPSGLLYDQCMGDCAGTPVAGDLTVYPPSGGWSYPLSICVITGPYEYQWTDERCHNVENP